MNTLLGYQVSQNQWPEEHYQNSVNNAGNPFAKSFYQMTSHEDERWIVNWFSEHVLGIKAPEKMWGYCATGSTESILCALWMARKRFASDVRIYASEEAHYCVRKIADILSVPYVSIPVQSEDGRMDMESLFSMILHDNANAIVVLTMGTTIRNAYDDIQEFYQQYSHHVKTNKSLLHSIHVHLDASFGGAVYPFLKKEWLLYPFHTFNVSFHKFWGCPYPCSLFLTTKDVQNTINNNGCYGKEMICLPEKDFTVSCSRSGIPVTLMRKLFDQPDFLTNHMNSLSHCFKTRDYCLSRIPSSKTSNHELSLSVEFKIIGDVDLYKKLTSIYSLNIRKTNTSDDDSLSLIGETHLYCCKHVDTILVDRFINDASIIVEHPNTFCVII